ncbi:hypothetical protein E4V99_17175 [Microbacterium sp. dk485]|uniref:hypothetical protein n=1 Tax=Microbacterium sp. dk485 TaxID=2560021 RepID=UPI0010742024|nr:hypothetical protein [Microbacterium sp. dk485]TFV80845.1 hypothetical protein E4V99_17175 [Microbacterium sp. dk485]
MLARSADVVGTALRGLFTLILRFRRPRPIHTRGLVLEGELTWLGAAAASGISWIDDAPPDPVGVVARLSRAVGLPARLPDVIGLALRASAGGRTVDLELASTGIGFPSRFLLVPRHTPTGATFGSLLPYRSSRGPILVCARSARRRPLPASTSDLAAALREEPWRVRLYFATPRGRWHPFAEAALRPSADQEDRELRFDSVRHPLPGAGTYRWVERVRQPSYLRVQGAQ